jgi:hypothetical protein
MNKLRAIKYIKNDYRRLISETKKEDEEFEEEIEAELEDEGEEEFDDVEAEGGGDGEIEVFQDAETKIGGTRGEVQDNLEAALEASKSLGDDKLTKQIGNSLTYFTRQHVVKEGYFSHNDLTSRIKKAGYDSFEYFFSDNPGAEEVLMSWIDQYFPEGNEDYEDYESDEESDLREIKKMQRLAGIIK